MSETTNCQSCGMTIDDGTYCEHCTNDSGKLQSFDETHKRMAQWMLRQEQAATREEAEKKTLAYMATMPAWRDHPKVKAAQG